MRVVGAGVRRRLSLRALVAAAILLGSAEGMQAQCVGDCTYDGRVTVQELIIGVNILLGYQPASQCAALEDDDGEVNVAQLVRAVINVLNGCKVMPATPTDTMAPTTATATSPPAVTATETSPPVATATATSPPTATATMDAASPTPTLTPVATATTFPIGDAVAGRVVLVSAGLSGVPAIVSAVTAQIFGEGVELTEVVVPHSVPLVQSVVPEVYGCPVSGTTAQHCGATGDGEESSVHVQLGADLCVVEGPASGTVEFDGDLTLDSIPGSDARCAPIEFSSATYTASQLVVVTRNDASDETVIVTADVTGSMDLVPIPGPAACPVASVALTLTGTVQSAFAVRGAVAVELDGTTVVMDQITFNDDCIPVSYRLTFNGPATIAAMTATGAVTSGVSESDRFDVTFSNFRIVQDATTTPAPVRLSGNLSSPCFNGPIAVLTAAEAPLEVFAGDICPVAGELSATGSGALAHLTYAEGGAVTVEQGGAEMTYPSCIAPEPLQCSTTE